MVHVLKATGDAQPFSEEKLVASIKRAGIPDFLQNKVVEHVKSKLYDDIPTSVIYHHVKEFLRHSEHPYTSARYSLKQAIMDLGPTGYPFEDYLSRILKSQGYETKVRQIIRGRCITHEIDVIAKKQTEEMMVEAKFHNMSGTKTNVHVAMYTKARFDDVRTNNGLTNAWLVTNTKITVDAIAFGACYGMKITSWEYPVNNSFREIVERAKLIPVTALTTLSQTQKAELTQQGVVLAKDIIDNKEALTLLHVPQKTEEIVREVDNLLNN